MKKTHKYQATGTNLFGETETIVLESTDIHTFMCLVGQQGIRNIKEYSQIN